MERRFGDEHHVGWTMRFDGRSAVYYDPFVSGGGRRITITFGGGLHGCTATAEFVKSGAAIIMLSSITHRQNEVLSVNPGPASCVVSRGNVFGAE